MIKRMVVLLAALAIAYAAASQPVRTFRVKIGVDRESVDSLGGYERVVSLTKDMFRQVNRAFNFDGRLNAVYHFEVDWTAFYVYDGVSVDEVFKPHPNHDYLVVMDGYKSHPREVGGGWYGDSIQTVYHSRTHNDRFNSPFEQNAIDGIIHEFGHARGIPDIYAMKVDAEKNPVNGEAFEGVRCIMNYPYAETHWSTYAVNMIDLSADRNIDIDDQVVGMLPERIRIEVADQRGKPVRGASVRFYPVRWYTYAVCPTPETIALTGRGGHCTVLVDSVFHLEKEFGVKYCNCLVEAEYDGVKTYGWLPLYLLQNIRFDGAEMCTLKLRLKHDCRLTRDIPVK